MGKTIREETAMRTIYSLLLLLGLTTSIAVADEGPEQQIRNALDAYHQAEVQGDLDSILNAYSEDFVDPQGVTKPVLTEFFRALVIQGILHDLVVDMSRIIIQVDGDGASVGPVSYTTMLGTNIYSYKMRKESDGSWRFTGSSVLN